MNVYLVWIIAFILLVDLLCLLSLVKLLYDAPVGEEIPGVGFVRSE